MSSHSSEVEPVLSRSEVTISSTDTNDFETPSLKQKHLNKDCPHLVPLDFQITIYDNDDDEEELVKPKRSLLHRIFFGSKSEKVVTDEIDGSKRNKRNSLWALIGFGCVIVVSVIVIYKRPILNIGR